jgi:hypothetical protein
MVGTVPQKKQNRSFWTEIEEIFCAMAFCETSRLRWRVFAQNPFFSSEETGSVPQGP